MLSSGGRNVIFFLAAGFFILGLANASQPAKTPKLKAATQVPNSASPHIEINHIFTAGMAKSAGLDPAQPTLSADGVHSGALGAPPTVQKLASTECLLAETVVQEANSLDAHAVDQYCVHTATDSKRYDDVLAGSESGTAPRMQEALVHIVVWAKGQWSGTWYQYERNSKSDTGVLLPLGSANAITSPPTHLLGKGGLGFLAIHFNIDDSCGIGYDITAKHSRPLNQQDAIDLISLAEGYASKGKTAAKGGGPQTTSPGVGIWGGQLLVATGPLPATVTFTPSLKQGAKVAAIPLASVKAGETPTWQVENSCTASTKPAPAPTSKTVKANTPSDEELGNGDSEAGQGMQRASSGESYSPAFYKETALLKAKSFSPARLFYLESQNRSGQATGGQNGAAGNGADQTKGQQDSASESGSGQNTDGQNGGAQNAKSAQSSNPLASGALSLPDEGFYWWDVSVALPVTSFNQLKYDSANNTLVVKNTNDIKPYALFDTYLGKADLRMQNAVSKPFFAVGVPMAGKPLQKSFFGCGFAVALKSFRLQALAGVRVEKDLLSSLTAGTTVTPAQVLTSQHSEWHAKLQVMVGFSVGDAAKVLGITAKKQGSN